jgi:hypothetical protein
MYVGSLNLCTFKASADKFPTEKGFMTLYVTVAIAYASKCKIVG